MTPPPDPVPSLVVTEARLRTGAVVDVHCAGGLVTALAPAGALAAPADAQVVPAAGGLVTEPFVDAHLHLDKVHTLPLIGDAALEAYTAARHGRLRARHRPGAGGQAALPGRDAPAGDPLGPRRG